MGPSGSEVEVIHARRRRDLLRFKFIWPRLSLLPTRTPPNDQLPPSFFTKTFPLFSVVPFSRNIGASARATPFSFNLYLPFTGGGGVEAEDPPGSSGSSFFLSTPPYSPLFLIGEINPTFSLHASQSGYTKLVGLVYGKLFYFTDENRRRLFACSFKVLVPTRSVGISHLDVLLPLSGPFWGRGRNTGARRAATYFSLL